MNFVHARLAMGTKIRELPIVNTFRRFSPAVGPRLRFLRPEPFEALERVEREYGYRR